MRAWQVELATALAEGLAGRGLPLSVRTEVDTDDRFLVEGPVGPGMFFAARGIARWVRAHARKACRVRLQIIVTRERQSRP